MAHSYLKSKLRSYLSGWFEEDLSDEAIKIGLLSGKLTLSNAELIRKDSIQITEEFSLSLEKGNVGKVELSIPWHSLYRNCLSLTLYDVNLLAQVHVSDLRQKCSDASILAEEKMVRVAEEELKQLGLSSIANSTWLSIALQRVIEALALQVVSSFTVVLNKVRLTLIFPLSDDQSLVFELNLDNLVVSMPKLSSRSSFTTSSAVASIAKQLTIRNMSIHMDSIVKPVNQRDIIILWEKPQYSYQEVVRLFDWTVVLQCCKESRSAASFNFSAFGLECSCTSIDISISLQQLLLIKNALEFAAMERRRLRLQSIRKDMLNWSSGDSSKSNFDPRSVWDYAIKAVLLVVREERNRSFGHMQHMQASIAKLVDRRKYIVLYRKKMDILLASYANNLFPTMILEDLPEGISAELTVQESKLSISELLEYRSVVNKQLLREAVDPSILVHIIMLAYPAVRKKFPNAEIAAMLRDVDSRDSKPEMQIRVMFTVARIAATVFQSGETITNASPLSSEINSSVVSLYTYGVSCSIDSRASLLEGYLGGVEVYGVDNGPLLSFGDFKDVSSVSEFRMQCFQGNSSLALSFSTQYIGKNDPSSQSMQDETNRFRSYESFAAADTHGNINHYLVYPSQQHLVIESKLSELTVHWSPDCITCMLNCLDLFDMSKYLSTGDPFQAEKRRLALQSIYAGSTSVLEEKLKVSMSVVLRSVKLQFPIQQSGTKSPTLSDSSSQVLELGFEDLQFISGDYLETLLLEFDKNRFANDESATAITDVGMGDALPRLLSTVQSIRNPLVHPLVFMLRGVFMKYVQTSDLHGQQVVGTILKSPWLADGAISMSSMPSHRDFTDLRCDLHLGPLEIQLRTQDVIYVADISSSVLQSLTSKLPSPDSPQSNVVVGKHSTPKLRRLEGLSVSMVFVHIDRIKITGIEAEHTKACMPYLLAIEQAIERSIEYQDTAVFYDSFVEQAYRSVLASQLRNFGFPESHVTGVADRCIDCVARPLRENETLCARIVDNLRALIEKESSAWSLPDWRSSYPSIEFQIELMAVDFDCHSFMYGMDLSLKFKHLTFFDADHISLVSVHQEMEIFKPVSQPGAKQSKATKPTKGTERRGSIAGLSKAPQDAVETQDSTAAQALIFTQSTRLLGEAISVFDLYNHEIYGQHEWKSDLKINCKDIYIYFNTERLYSISNYCIDLACDIMIGLRERQIDQSVCYSAADVDRTSISTPRSTSQGDKVSTDTFQMDIGRIIVILACKNRLFSSVLLNGSQLKTFNSLEGTNISAAIQDLNVFDLTPAGMRFREVLWRKEISEKTDPRLRSSPSPVVSVDIYQSSHVLRILPWVNGIRIAFLHRFLVEYIIVVSESIATPISLLVARASDVGNKNFPVSSPREAETSLDDDVGAGLPNQQPSEPPVAVEIVCQLKDVQGLVPRNSFSNDVIGLSVDSATVEISSISDSWPIPKKTDLERILSRKTPWEYPLYFNFRSNAWEEGGACNRRELPRQNANVEDDEIFFDACEFTPRFDTTSIKTGQTNRTAVEAEGISIFVSLAPPLAIGELARFHDVGFDKRFDFSGQMRYAEIVDCKDVFKNPAVQGAQSWILVSRSKLNLQVIIDINATQLRMLFGDTRNPSMLDVAVSQSEFYLLLGLWFDNIHEYPRFPVEHFTPPSYEGEPSTSTFPFSDYGSEDYLRFYLQRSPTLEIAVVRAEVSIGCAIDTNYFAAENPHNLYLKFVNDFDRSVLGITNERFRSYTFEKTPESASVPHREGRRFSTKLSVGHSSRRVAPIADLHCVGLFLYSCADHDVLQLSVSASLLEVYDCRAPLGSSIPLLLRLAPLEDPTCSHHLKWDSSGHRVKAGVYSYGYPDVEYGFNCSAQDTERVMDLPIKFSMLSPLTSNWLTMCLGLDLPDLNLACLDVCLLLSDFFSSYFRFASFGHPGLAAYDRLNAALIPYGGIDFRFFLMRPHLSIIDASSGLNPSAMFIETERGAFFRYMSDTDWSVRMELNLHDLALVLVKHYRPPSLSRGARGSSGSGRGVRTMVEFLNCALIYKFLAKENQLDIECEAYIPEEEDEETRRDENAYVDLNGGFGGIDAVTIHEPTCLLPIGSNRKDFTPYSSNIVTSWEDIVFCNKIISQLLAWDKYQESDVDEKEPAPTGCAEGSVLSKYFVFSITGVRVLLVDNVLGLHLPLFQGFCESVRYVIDLDGANRVKSSEHDRPDSLVTDGGRKHSFIFSPDGKNQSIMNSTPTAVVCFDERIFGSATLWVDYFNNLKKCWEPCFEKLSFSVQYEKSRSRGVGFIIRSSSALQVYLSGALIRTLYDAMRSFKSDSNVVDAQSSSSNKALGDSELTSPDWFDDLSNERRKSLLETKLVSFSLNKLESKGDLNNHKPTSWVKGGRRRSSIIVGNPNLLSNTGMDRIDHIPSISLLPSLRVGFSILNMTGQPIRYLQQWEGGKRTVQYLNNNERGLLNIVAAQTLIRNGRVVEETFEVQQEQMATMKARSHRRVVGNRVALQISGYRWLHSVQADELGVQFEELFPILGRVDATRVFRDERIAYSLKLMVEVLPHCGGRMLRLRSVFSVKNFTKHKLQILARRGSREFGLQGDNSSVGPDGTNQESPFFLGADEEWYIPIALLYQSIIESQGRSLGVLFFKPAELKPIEEELESKLGVSPGFIDYSTDPISLFQLASKGTTQEIADLSPLEPSSDPVENSFGSAKAMQLCCHVSPKQRVRHGRRFGSKDKSSGQAQASESDRDAPLNGAQAFATSKLPPFCYSVEIIRDMPNKKSKDSPGNELHLEHPRSFTIAIHPPILIENLLPSHGVFELLHAEQKRVLWSSCIAPGAMKAVHTVTLEEPLVLVINLRYCRASEGVLVHRPHAEGSSQRGLVNKLQRAIEGILEEGEQDDVSSMILTDTVGQRLRLNVENTQGAGGQRHIVVYCPYWIVNTSQYAFRLREEGEMELTAGSVTAQQDGTRPVPLSNSAFIDQAPVHEIFDPNRIVNANRMSDLGGMMSPGDKNPRSRQYNDKRDNDRHDTEFRSPVFPGCCGPLHSHVRKEVDLKSPVCELFRELNIDDATRMAYMFNYRENSSVLSNNKKVKLQLDDTDWSRPFSLESVGVNQVISVDHPTRGLLEVGLKITVAPGRLAKYTKIVRFAPRLGIVNRLNVPLRALQASGLTGEMSEIEVSANHIRAYHLPALFGERAISLLVDGPWRKTVFFKLDQIGAFTIEAKRQIDLASIPHVNTRGAPEYTEFLPPSKVVGIFFETDWGEENIVVKAIQTGSFAARETDIRVGDVLLAIDDEEVNGSQFELAMVLLKTKVADQGCNIKLRTVEEKLRLIRETAFQASQKTIERRRSQSTIPQQRSMMSPLKDHDSISESTWGRHDYDDHRDVLPLRVELRLIESTIMVLVNELSGQFSTEYRIENRSVCYRIHYKQKGIPGSAWSVLNPGQSCNYCWPDPFKPHKLLVHVGDNVLCPSDSRNSTTLAEGGELSERGRGDDTLGTYLSYLAGVSNDTATSISLDEIGSKESLPLRRSEGKLLATIKSEGPTKVLLIVPSLDRHDLLKEMRYCTTFLRDLVTHYTDMEGKLAVLLDTIRGEVDNRRIGSIKLPVEEIFKKMTVDLNECQRKALLAVNAFTMVSFTRSDAGNDDSGPLPLESHLASFKPLERVLEGGIDCQHQLLVEVLEACELAPLVNGKTEDTYCKLYVRNDEDTVIEKVKAVTYYTYVCDQSLDPKWTNQKFVFDIDPRAATQYRSYNLRLLVKAKSVVGIDNVLAKLDVPFSCLREEEVVEGWFPLRPSRSSMLLFKASGSIKLRLQWVHSEKGYVTFLHQQVDSRLRELQLQYDVQKYFRRAVEKQVSNQLVSKQNAFDSEVSYAEENDYYAMVERVAMQNSRKRSSIRMMSGKEMSSRKHTDSELEEVLTNDPSFSPLNSDDMRGRLSLTPIVGEEKVPESSLSALGTMPERLQYTPFSSIDNPREQTKSLRQVFRSNSFKKNRDEFAVLHYCDINMARWIRATAPLRHIHSQLSTCMARPRRLIEQNGVFRSQFDREGWRSYAHAFTQNGVLEIAPIQALHLPAGNNYVFVKISYGNEKFSTFSVPPAAFTTWHQESSVETASDSAERLDCDDPNSFDGIPASLSKTFDIDLLNIKGNVHVRIMTEGFPKSQQIASVELPIFGIVDCTCTLGANGGCYDRWFPLTVTDSASSNEEGQSYTQSQVIQAEKDSYASFGYQPCIRLRMKWIPMHDLSRVEDPELYGRLQVPSISMSFVDSEHYRAVMLATVSNLEVRQAVTKVYTDVSANVASIQVDNQLPDPMANVILFPKIVKNPQPVIRLHFRRKNLLSQRNLECFQTIQLVVQELDLQLEQQTVLAAWALIKNWLHESKQGNEDRTLDRSTAPGTGRTTSPAPVSDKSPVLVRQPSIPDGDVIALLHDEDTVKLYIEDFRIFPIKINVSFLISPPHVVHVYRRQLKRLEMQTESSSISSSLWLFLWQVGEVVLDLTSSISDAPIFFNGFEAPHLFKTSADVTRILQEHYLHSALGQLYKIVGSLDVVGNPIALLSSLSVGVRDFFYEPAHALITSPTAFGKIGKGVVKGTVSLVSNTTAGFLGTGTTITRSIGRGFAKLSMDSSYIKAREKLQKTPGTIKGTLLRPAKDVAVGVVYSVTGLVKVPYSSVKAHGIRGFVPGVAKGVAGLVVDPAVGILDAVTHSGDACKEILKSLNKGKIEEVRRVRLGDLFGPDGRLLAYNVQIALGAQILRAFGRFNDVQGHPVTQRGSFLSAARDVWRGGRSSVAVDRARGLSLAHKDSVSSEDPSSSNPFSPFPKRNSMVVRKNRFSFRSLDSDMLSLDSTALGVGVGDGDRLNSLSRHAWTEAVNEEAAVVASADDDGTSEYVVHTAILQPSNGVEVVAILSTARILITEHSRGGYGLIVNKLWECALKDLAAPILERGGGSSNATLVLRSTSFGVATTGAESLHRKRMGFGMAPRGRGSDLSFSLIGSYQEEDVLINLYNCLNAATGHFAPLIPPYNINNDACVEDEFGVRHVGPWQFVARKPRGGRGLVADDDEDDTTVAEQKRKLIRELELERWVHAPSPLSGLSKALWLRAEEDSALDCHSRVRELYQRCKAMEREIISHPQSKQYLRIPIESLFKGNITVEEFERAISQSPQLLDDSTTVSDLLSLEDRDKMGNSGAEAKSSTSWRGYLRFGQSPNRPDQRFFSLFSSDTGPAASAAGGSEVDGPPGETPREDSGTSPSIPSPSTGSKWSLRGIFPMANDGDADGVANGEASAETATPGVVATEAETKFEEDQPSDEEDDGGIVQKAPFSWLSPPPRVEEAREDSPVASPESMDEDVIQGEAAEEKGEAPLGDDVGFTYSDLRPRDKRSRRAEQFLPNNIAAVSVTPGSVDEVEAEVAGENPLFVLARPRAMTLRGDAQVGDRDNARRWSSPAVLPRLVTPPRSTMEAAVQELEASSPKQMPMATPGQSGGPQYPSTPDDGHIVERLDRLEGLLVHLLDHLTPTKTTPPPGIVRSPEPPSML